MSRRTTRRLGLLTAGGLSIAAGLALAWDAVDPSVVRGVPTGGLVLIVAMVALPMVLLGTAGAARLERGAASDATGLDEFDDAPNGAAGTVQGATGLVRHESHGGDRHERPHTPRTPRSRAAHRAVESGDGWTKG